MTNELAVFDEVAATIAEWKAENEKLVFEYNTPQGEKDARSHIAKLRKVKTKVGEIHKEAKSEALAFGRKLDAKKNEYNGEVDGMIKFHKDPLDAIAAEKQAIIDAEEAKAAEEEAKRLADIEAREKAVKDAEEEIAKEKAEAERVEREKRIAEEAAAKAKEQAEAKEQRRIANKKHRKEIEDAVHFALTEIGLNEGDAGIVVIALEQNAIPHVSINY